MSKVRLNLKTVEEERISYSPENYVYSLYFPELRIKTRSKSLRLSVSRREA